MRRQIWTAKLYELELDSQICLVLKILILGSTYMLYLFQHITFFFLKKCFNFVWKAYLFSNI